MTFLSYIALEEYSVHPANPKDIKLSFLFGTISFVIRQVCQSCGKYLAHGHLSNCLVNKLWLLSTYVLSHIIFTKAIENRSYLFTQQIHIALIMSQALY